MYSVVEFLKGLARAIVVSWEAAQFHLPWGRVGEHSKVVIIAPFIGNASTFLDLTIGAC